jgi:hypothetical protein
MKIKEESFQKEEQNLNKREWAVLGGAKVF